MDEKKFWLTINNAIRASDAATVRRELRRHPQMIPYNRGGTWLHTAVDEHAAPMIRLLVELGCPLDDKDDFDETPLGQACGKDHPDTVRTLLELGANPNLPGTYYPLNAIALSIEHRVEILQLLDQFGCDLCRVYEHPLGPTTPLSYAMDSDSTEVIEYLRAKGCPLAPSAASSAEAAPAFADRKLADVIAGKWGSVFARSIGPKADVTSVQQCWFGDPATADQIENLETYFNAKLPRDVKELLSEFNGVKVGKGKTRDKWYLTTDEIKAAVRFYDDRESDLVLSLFPKVLFVCQQNGMAELWGVVLKPFKPFKRGDIAAFEHDRIDEAESAAELFTTPYENLEALVEAKWKTYE